MRITVSDIHEYVIININMWPYNRTHMKTLHFVPRVSSSSTFATNKRLIQSKLDFVDEFLIRDIKQQITKNCILNSPVIQRITLSKLYVPYKSRKLKVRSEDVRFPKFPAGINTCIPIKWPKKHSSRYFDASQSKIQGQLSARSKPIQLLIRNKSKQSYVPLTSRRLPFSPEPKSHLLVPFGK